VLQSGEGVVCCAHDGSLGFALQSTDGVVDGLEVLLEPLSDDDEPRLEGGCDVVTQGGAEPSGNGVGQLPLESGVEPLSQLDCPVVEFSPYVDGDDGAIEGEGVDGDGASCSAGGCSGANPGFAGGVGGTVGGFPEGVAGMVFVAPGVAGTVFGPDGVAGMVFGPANVGETVLGVCVGVMVAGEMVFGAESGAVGVGCVMTTGGGVTICVFVC